MINSGMKILSDYVGKTLILHQPSIFKKYFQLFFESEVIGSIEIPKNFGSKALVKIFNTTWEIKRESIWKNRLGIYQYGYELPIAIYSRKNFGKGFLKLDKGIILWLYYSVWKGISEIRTESGKVLISAKNKSIWKSDREVKIIERNELLNAKPWILLLLLFVDLTRQRH